MDIKLLPPAVGLWAIIRILLLTIRGDYFIRGRWINPSLADKLIGRHISGHFLKKQTKLYSKLWNRVAFHNHRPVLHFLCETEVILTYPSPKPEASTKTNVLTHSNVHFMQFQLFVCMLL